MSIAKHTMAKFEDWRLFRGYPAVDAILKQSPDGVDISVPRRGTYHFRLTPPLTLPFMRYGRYWVQLTTPAAAKLLSADESSDK